MPTDETQYPGNNYKVRLISVLSPRSRVVFEVTPTFSESRAVEYSPVTPVHMPGSIQVYKRTNSRTFSVGAKLISRSTFDTDLNLIYLQRLRSWTMPFFGANSSTLTSTQQKTRTDIATLDTQLQGVQTIPVSVASPTSSNTAAGQEIQRNNLQSRIDALRQSQGIEMLGAPPEVLYLYGYSSSANDNRKTGFVNINRIPVVITNLSISYPEDVDYLPSSFGDPFPIRMDVTIELAETHSPTEYARFSLTEFKLGQLKNF